MYIDYLKQQYLDKTEEKRKEYIDRDKKQLGILVQEKITNDIENIIERWYELDDVGYIPEDEKFLYLLKEAEQLYAFSYYTGTISIIGIAAEEYCRFLMEKNQITDVAKQIDRIDKLFENKAITKNIKKALHDIRKIRNSCMHYNNDFKNLGVDKLKQYAFNMIDLFKRCLEPLTQEITDYTEITAKLLESKEMTFREFVYRNRNILKEVNGQDFQIDPSIPWVKFIAKYYIAEIDISTDKFKELTLVDLDHGGFFVVVDLTLCQAERIKDMKLMEGNIIVATLLSKVSTVGQTEEWLLLDIHDVYRERIDFFDLEKINKV